MFVFRKHFEMFEMFEMFETFYILEHFDIF